MTSTIIEVVDPSRRASWAEREFPSPQRRLSVQTRSSVSHKGPTFAHTDSAFRVMGKENGKEEAAVTDREAKETDVETEPKTDEKTEAKTEVRTGHGENSGASSGASSGVISAPEGAGKEAEEEVWLHIEDVLEGIGVSWKQACLLTVTALSYGHFSMQSMVASLVTPSLWEKWPYLEDAPVTFNVIHATGAFCRLAGSLFLVPLSDRIGRYPILVWGMLVSAVLSGLASLSPNFACFVAIRGIISAITATLPSIATVYAVELMKVKHRGMPSCAAQIIASLYVAYGTGMKMAMEDKPDTFARKDIWRWSALFFQIPTIFPLLWLILYRKETPRFTLSVKNDRKTAWKTFSWLNRKGRKNLLEKLGLNQNVNPETHVKFLAIDDAETPTQAGCQPWARVEHLRAIFVSAEYRRTTLALTGIWALQSFVHWGVNSYVMVFYRNLGIDANLTSLLSFAFQFPVHIFTYWVMSARFGGRIRAIQINAFISSVLSIVVAIAWAGGNRTVWFLTLTSVGSNLTGAPIWGPVYSYSAERYSTVLRGTAMGYFGAITAISTIVTTYVGSISTTGSRIWIMPLIWGLLRVMLVPITFLLDREVRDTGLADREKISA